MGSKKKTISSVGYTKLLPQDKNLFIEAINKALGQSYTIDSAFLCSTLMEINKAHRYKAFQKLDGATKINASAVNLDIRAVYAAYGFSCSDDKPTVVNSGNSAEYQFYSGLGKSTAECDGYKVFDNYAYKNFSIDDATGMVSAMRMIVDTSKTPCEVTDDIIVTRPGTADNIIMLTVENQTLLKTSSVWFPEGQFSSYIVLDGMTFLTVSYKSNFVKNTSRYIKAMNAQLGIPQKTPKDDGDGSEEPFEDAINNNEYRDIFLSYAVPYEGDYTTIIDQIYGGMDIKFNFKYTTVSASGGANNFWQPMLGPGYDYCEGVFGSSGALKTMLINGEPLTLDSGQEQQYIIPIEWMQKERTLLQKYDDLGKAMTMFIYAQKTVKVMFYQTGFFKFLGFIIGIVLTVATGNPMILAAMITSYAIGAILSPKAAAIFSIIMAVVTFGQSLANAAMTMVDAVVKIIDIAANAFKIYFERSMKSIQASIDEKVEKAKEAKEELDDMLSTPINIGFLSDKMDEFYELAYESVYNSYSMAYNYDNMYQGQKYE